jgi:excisionase family DNA binding protein
VTKHNSTVSKPKKWVGSTFIAAACGASIETIARWANDGILPPFVRVGRNRRWRRQDVEQFLNERGIPIPQDEGAAS